MNAVVGGMPAKARRVMRAMVVLVCAMGLLAAMGGQAQAKKHKHKPKKPTDHHAHAGHQGLHVPRAR